MRWQWGYERLEVRGWEEDRMRMGMEWGMGMEDEIGIRDRMGMGDGSGGWEY